MPVPDPKKDQSNASGGAQKSAYPLDNYTVAPKGGDGGDEKSPYFKSAAPSISLPKGGGALKGIDEKFTVNAVNGTASLQVQFPFTPGRGGFTPSLSLSYNSGGGNSEFGLGWSMGLPSIQRKTDKRLPRYDDPNESDVFLMAGAEDLQPLLYSSSGSWVQDILTDYVEGSNHYTVKRYRPRIEGLFAQIEHVSRNGATGSWWKVTSKENVVTYYGLTAEARISDPQDASRIFKWLPQLSYDKKGNVQIYNYVTDTASSIAPVALHEKNRMSGLAPFTNTYLKSVSWCNTTPYTANTDFEPAFSGDYHFMMIGVLDYGNYNATAPDVTDNNAVPVRVDPFSDFHAGFEIRTYRKCQRVLMFHKFSELLSVVTSGTVPTACLVKSLNLTYNLAGTSALAEADYITTIGQSGYKLNSNATYMKKDMPAMQFSYAPLVWDRTVKKVSVADSINAPQGLTGSYQWIDLWGEGLPGILTEQGQGWFYKSNLGDGHFTPALSVAEKPSFSGLGGAMQWSDLDADGRRQLVSKSNAMPGYFELDDDQNWQPFRTFDEWINVDWDSPFTKALDLNGDGRPDLLITEENAWKWYENEGTEGYSEGGYGTVSLDEEKKPRMLHNDMVQVIFLADMNGDGMTDIVRVQNEEVCYWPNMGYGKFGAKVTMSNAPKFDLPDAFDPKYLTLADISGTGAPDLIYIGKNKCTAWINLAGNGFATGVDICDLPGMELFSKVTVTDFLGSGTSCILWSSPLPNNDRAPMRYIDLMGGNKPYLMSSYVNGMGKKVELTYKQSTKYYLEDKAAGKTWATRLPFPVHCVQQIKTSDTVSNTSYIQQYSYHHGYYDHEEREFRGFGRVETIDTDIAYAYNDALTAGHTSSSDLNQYPVKTVSWYHTGAWLRSGTLLGAFAKEYYPPSLAELPISPNMPAGLTPQEQREAHRALKGQPLRQEVYALDGSSDQTKPYTVTTHAYAVILVQPAMGNRFASFLSFQEQSLSFSCERVLTDARIVHELTLATDIYGNVLKSAKVCYPRLSSSIPSGTPSVVSTVQQKMLCTYTENVYTNDVLSDTTRHLRVLCETKTYEITGLTLSSGIWTCASLNNKINGLSNGSGGWSISPATEINFTTSPSTATTPPVEKKCINATRTLYAGNTTTGVGLTLGTIESLTIPYQQYHQAITDDMLSNAGWYGGLITSSTMLTTEGGYLRENDITQFGSSSTTRYWLPGGTITYSTSNFYTPTAYTDPWGHTTTVTYWTNSGGTNYYLLPSIVTDAVSNSNTVTAYNWCNLQPTSVTDPNSNISEAIYDALGMPVAMALKGKGTQADALGSLAPDGTSDGAAQISFWTSPAANAGTLLGTATWRCVYDLSASPVRVAMIGREKHNADLGSGETSPMLMRFTYTDGFGRVAMNKVQAEPDESTPTTARWIGSGKTIYNNKGKAVMQYEPYFSGTHAFDQAEAAATVGVTARIHYDALGRVVQTDLPDGSFTKTVWDAWKQTSYDNNDTLTTTGNAWYTAYSSSSDASKNDAANKAYLHANTPTVIHLDTLARPFYTIQNDKFPDTSGTWTAHAYESYVVLDLAGDRLEVHDARGITTLTYSYNMLKAPVKQVSVDSGTQRTLTDAANQPLYAWDAESNRHRHTYDNIHRPVSKEVQTSSGTKIVEYMIYGEGMTSSDTNNNLRGKLYRGYDGAGLQEISNYDFKGNPLTTVRTFTTAYTQSPDWTSTNRGLSGYLESTTHSTSMMYDGLGRPKTITTPDGALTTYAYEKAGMLYSVGVSGVHALATGIIKSITYDAKGQRLKLQTQSDHTTAGTVITTTNYTYDPKTFRVIRILTTRNSDSAVMQDLNYWFDPVGNITRQNDAALTTVFFSGTVVTPVNDYTYDALYRLIKAGGRELAGAGAAVNSSDSDKTGRVAPTDTSAMRKYIQYYSYDEVGNMLEMKHTAGVSSYTNYWTRTFAVEKTTGTTPVPINNRLHTSSIGSGTTGAETYTYDNRGNITGGMNHLNAGGASMTYNEENRLEKVIITSELTAYYQYDSGGQRVRKVVENSTTHVAKSRKYVGQWELYKEFNTITSTVSLIRETLHVMDDGARVALIDSELNVTSGALTTQNIRYQYSIHLSTASLELDYAAALISFEEYYPYGSTSFQSGRGTAEVSLKRYRYTGKEKDEETGLYYIGARYYAHWLARWVADDPINSEYSNICHGHPERNHERQHVEMTASGYEYCYDNPVRFEDPTGEQAVSPFQAKAAASAVAKNLSIGGLLLSPGNYESIAKMAFHKNEMTPQQYQGHFSSVKGKIGEIQFAGRTVAGYAPFFASMPSFNSNQGQNSALRHDVKATLTPIKAVMDAADKGMPIPFTGGARLKFYPQLSFSDPLGGTVKREVSRTEKTNLFFEVKTLSSPNFANIYNTKQTFEQIVSGFDQATRTASALKGQPNSISVLAVDKDAFGAVMKDPAFRGILIEKYSELKIAGGELQLLSRQNERAENTLNKIISDAKTK